MAQSPHIGGERLHLVRSQLSATHGRHRAAILFWLHHALGDGFCNTGVTPIAPQPLGVGQVGAERSSLCAGAMAACARRSANFTVVDTITQSHHLCGCSGWWSQAGIGVRAFRRLGLGFDDLAGASRRARAWSRVALESGSAGIRNAVNSALDVVRYIERPIGSDREPAWTMLGRLRSLDSRKAIGEYLARAGRSIAVQRLKDNVVAALRIRCTIPGTMEGDEHAGPVVSGKLLLIIEHCAIGSPMRGKGCYGSDLAGADTSILTPVAAVFRSQHQLVLHLVVIALRPSIVAALLQQNQFFRRQGGFFFRLIQVGPIRMQLIASVLGDVDPLAGCIDRETFTVTNSGGETVGRGKHLVGAVRVVAPDAAPGLQFRAGVGARRLKGSVLQLA